MVTGLCTFLNVLHGFSRFHRFDYFSLVPCRLLILQHYTHFYYIHWVEIVFVIANCTQRCRLVHSVPFDFSICFCFYCCCFTSAHFLSFCYSVIRCLSFLPSFFIIHFHIRFIRWFVCLFAGEDIFTRMCFASTLFFPLLPQNPIVPFWFEQFDAIRLRKGATLFKLSLRYSFGWIRRIIESKFLRNILLLSIQLFQLKFNWILSENHKLVKFLTVTILVSIYLCYKSSKSHRQYLSGDLCRLHCDYYLPLNGA